MKRFLRIFLSLSILIISLGCANVNTGYYWENYSQTLYAYKKDPSEKTLKKHISELKKIIEKNDSKGLRTPPGIHAELGYRLAELEAKEEALNEFEKEKIDYPESTTFIDRIKKLLGF